MKRIRKGNVYSKLEGFSRKQIDWVRNRGFIYIEPTDTDKTKQHLIDREGVFPAGLTSEVESFLKDHVGPIPVCQSDQGVDPISTKRIEKVISSAPFSPRPYQRKMIEACAENRYGVIHAATGAGKTYVMALSIAMWGLKTLVVVNSKDLMFQLKEEIEEYLGLRSDSVGIIGGGHHDEGDWITIATTQSISSKSQKKRKKMAGFCKEIDYLIIDECHHTQAITYRKVIDMCYNVVVRHGFSATPMTSTMKDSEGNWFNNDILLKAWLGETFSRTSTRDLINMGYLAEPIVRVVTNSMGFEGDIDFSIEYKRRITYNKKRNSTICQIAKEGYDEDKKVIIFVTKIPHGEGLLESLIKMGVHSSQVAFVCGETPDRASVIESFKSGDVKILIGTVLSEGLNFTPEIGINASAGRQPKETIQRVGRILRKPRRGSDVDPEEKRVVYYYDFQDAGNYYFASQFQSRNRVYRKEGHKIELVGDPNEE